VKRSLRAAIVFLGVVACAARQGSDITDLC
jgi:hypothetical protein